MKNDASWGSAFKIAGREARASAGKFVFVVLAVSAGVGALTGVRGFSGSFQDMLLRDARTLMAGDLSVRLFNETTPEQEEVFAELTKFGVRRTWITETVSMMSSETTSRPLLVSVKAVEPNRYPFYGEIRLSPEGKLSDLLTDQSMVVSNDLFLRLGVKLGDWVRLGDEQFRLAAEVVLEPDRMTGTWNVGPRVMITRAGLDRAGLMRPGSRASQRYLFRMPAQGITITSARALLETRFKGDRIVDFRETHPTLRRGLDRATKFLSLVSLIALIVGAIGVAMAMHSHLQQRLDTIAIMKCLGGRSSQIMRIYLIQTIGLGLTGSALGVLFGYGVQAWFPNFIQNFFPELSAFEWQPIAALQGLLIGLCTTLLITVPTLLSIRQVRPALVFRREMESRGLTLRQRFARLRGSLLSGAVILAALAALAVWLGESLILGAWFGGGLLVSFLVLALVAWLLLKSLRKLPRWLPWKLSTSVKQGLANLHRPGNHAEAVLTALGIGVTFTLTVYLVQSSVISQMVRSAPPEMPNVFFVNVTDLDRDGLLEMLQSAEGIEGEPELVPSVAARLVSVDGKPADQFTEEGPGRRFRRIRTITWRAEQPEHIEVLEGAWWDPKYSDREAPLVAASEGAASTLGLKLGSKVEWHVSGRSVTATVAVIHRSEGIRPGATVGFILTPEALAGLPVSYYGGIRVSAERAVELQRQAFEMFPTITVINAADVLDIVQDVVDQIAMVVRFVSAFAILGGIIILASGVMATRFRRIREVAILKTLGATRKRLANIFSTEFLILGAASGVMGAALASGFSNLMLERVLDAEYHFDPVPAAVAVIATAVLANVAGWLSSLRILGKKPLEVLRSE